MTHPRDKLLAAALSYASSEHGDETGANYADELDFKEDWLKEAAIDYVVFAIGADPEHVFEVGATEIAIQHPLTCRAVGDTLLKCPIGMTAMALDGPPAEPGFLYYADFDPETRTLSNWRRKEG